jgi:hypothetical protein
MSVDQELRPDETLDEGAARIARNALYEVRNNNGTMDDAGNVAAERILALFDWGDGIRRLMVERARQVGLGYDAVHDDAHEAGQLRQAAFCYLREAMGVDFNTEPPPDWPFEAMAWQPGQRIDDLVQVGAFVVAEIERLVRAEQRANPEPS